PVDQGFEHGPARSFASNPEGFDPAYHFELGIAAQVSALAAPYGFLAACADHYAGAIPLILKANNADNLATTRNQAITATAREALELGCSAMGYTIYPGSDFQYDMFEEVRVGIAEARAVGLPSVIWAYPRGGSISKEGETALDVVSYAAHIAALLGAHVIKVKPPTDRIEFPDAKPAYETLGRDFSKLQERVRHVVESALGGRRIVLFSGGPARTLDELYAEVGSIVAGGGGGSIIGRNSFQRPKAEALAMLGSIADAYLADAMQGAP
ncbi:MAG: class I fructose-bisphosphate aldolase, partial [Alphaproteobacteria bacterium]